MINALRKDRFTNALPSELQKALVLWDDRVGLGATFNPNRRLAIGVYANGRVLDRESY